MWFLFALGTKAQRGIFSSCMSGRDCGKIPKGGEGGVEPWV